MTSLRTFSFSRGLGLAAFTLTLMFAACATDDPANNTNGSTANSSTANSSTANSSTANSSTTNNPTCFGTEEICGGACVNTMTDANHCGGCGQPCGVAASCVNGVCECGEGAFDCNGDSGTAGTDGCECVGTCIGPQCEVAECDVDVAFSCSADDSTVCNAGSCGTCAAGTTNCDGLGSTGCECNFPCASDGSCPACDYDTAGACNGDTSMWCSSGTCAACEDGKSNCDTLGTCECEGDCNGSMCDAMACTYEMENACNNDDSMWCSSISNNTCVSCSEGFFNCNNKLGCECDSAGCNGELCAGNCMSGLAEECP